MNKKVLITGVTGQDGSYMADYLLANTDHQIFGMVRRAAKPDYSNIKSALKNPRFKLVTGDLGDSQSIENVVREIQPDYFINFAAQSFVGASWQIPEQTFEVGAMGVLRCLEAIRKFKPDCRFYSAGSSEEMGDVIYTPQDLNHPIRPRSPYGAAKAAARHLTKVYRDSYNLYAVHCILYNHESERRGIEFVTHKITNNVARIKYALDNNQPFEPLELGNLEAKRDWSHAKDFVHGVWLMMNQEKPKEYILSSQETHSIREFVEKAFAVAGIQGQWYITDNDPKTERYVLWNSDGTTDGKSLMVVNPKFYRPAEVDLLLGDSSVARKELGWQPEISFDKLIELMVKSDIDEYRRGKEAEKIK
jgi:GDPmannose 4,6-dehydratase